MSSQLASRLGCDDSERIVSHGMAESVKRQFRKVTSFVSAVAIADAEGPLMMEHPLSGRWSTMFAALSSFIELCKR